MAAGATVDEAALLPIVRKGNLRVTVDVEVDVEVLVEVLVEVEVDLMVVVGLTVEVDADLKVGIDVDVVDGLGVKVDRDVEVDVEVDLVEADLAAEIEVDLAVDVEVALTVKVEVVCLVEVLVEVEVEVDFEVLVLVRVDVTVDRIVDVEACCRSSAHNNPPGPAGGANRYTKEETPVALLFVSVVSVVELPSARKASSSSGSVAEMMILSGRISALNKLPPRSISRVPHPNTASARARLQ